MMDDPMPYTRTIMFANLILNLHKNLDFTCNDTHCQKFPIVTCTLMLHIAYYYTTCMRLMILHVILYLSQSMSYMYDVPELGMVGGVG